MGNDVSMELGETWMLTENLLGILPAGGLDPQDAACDILILLVTGAAREHDVRRPHGRIDHDGRTQADDIRASFAGLRPDRFPLLAAHAEHMVAGDSDERFRFGIDAVLDGVFAGAARPRPAKGTR